MNGISAEANTKLPSGQSRVAIGRQLRHVPEVLTLGVRPTLLDYSEKERLLLFSGEKIFFPTLRYADLFQSLGIPTYPGWSDYNCLGNKVRQTQIFQALGIPHPRTAVYIGSRQTCRIESDFSYPFIAKIPCKSSRGHGVFLVKNSDDLKVYLARTRTAYIQEYLPSGRDMRVVVMAGTMIHAYWREAGEENFLSNLAQGGRIGKAKVPAEALELAVYTARKCGFLEVGLDIISHGGAYYVIEANMKFGTEGLEHAGINLNVVRARMVREGII